MNHTQMFPYAFGGMISTALVCAWATARRFFDLKL